MRAIIFLGSLFCLSGFPSAWAADWQSDAANSHLYFAPSFEGMPINGVFKQFSTIYKTDQQGQPSQLHVDIAVTSADMGNSDINEAIRAVDWFNVNDFPQATFVSEEFINNGENTFLAVGTLRLKGFTKPVTVPFHWHVISQERASMTGEVVLARTDFSIGTGEWASDDQIGLAVKIWFDVVLTRSATDQ